MATKAPDVVCAIVAGDVGAAMVARTPSLIAFLDHRPLFPGHVLVCPLPHVETLLDLPDDKVGRFFTAVKHIDRAVVEALGCQGTFVAMNNVVSQSVPHLHCHVVPRTKGDALRGFFWPRTTYADGEIDQVAALIRAAVPQHLKTQLD